VPLRLSVVLARQLGTGLALSVSALILLPALPLYGKIARVLGVQTDEERGYD
jgi:hypothetical protein